MKLKSVTIHKYKSIESDQCFEIEKDITVLVGMNESGKTSVLEAIAKSNYFQDDPKFKYSTTHDYPRKEKKRLDKSGENPKAITCVFSITDSIKVKMAKDLGEEVISQSEFSISFKYSKPNTYLDINANTTKFIEGKTKQLGISSKALNEKLMQVKSLENLNTLISEYSDENYKKGLQTLLKYFKNEWNWASDPINEYIARVYLKPNLPKFLYYDEYYSLPSRINIEDLQKDDLIDEELKTAKALFDLAEINVDEIISATSFEDFKAELEATQAIISNELFKYWDTNKNLEIVFEIDKIEKEIERTVNNGYQNVTIKDVKIVNHVLDIRVKNRRTGVSLPLKNRSKGFNWFFSFLVWFKKIQEDKNSNYILLLDEPGLNLHASAQSNLLRFFNDLSKDYQILYSTHSPFMIESNSLNKVRTVLETENGTVISDTIQEKDPNTLFPLQAALGYDIAQNLFISNYNLLVEGASDLLYLQVLSSILKAVGRIGLDEKITIVPVGGLDKVSTFISLLRGSALNVVCLLDTFKDAKSRDRLTDMIEHKIITQKRIKFFNDYLADYTTADIEDLFNKKDYLKLYNEGYPTKQINIGDLNPNVKPIIIQIEQFINSGFNHYKPANKLAAKGVDSSYFSEETLSNFENVFKDINSLF